MSNEKPLTKEQINLLLRRKINLSTQYDHLIEKPPLEPIKLEKGNTFYTVAMIKKFVQNYYRQVSKLAQVLNGKSPEATVNNIQNFLFNNIQYQIDFLVQHIRSPANIWHNRKTGVECKNFSLFASAVLTNLGIKHYIRQIKQRGIKPKQFTHVYVVVPVNQVTGVLDDGYYTIDGTKKKNVESMFIEKKDVFMNDKLPHEGLNSPVPGKGKAAQTPKKTLKPKGKTLKPKGKTNKRQFPFN